MPYEPLEEIIVRGRRIGDLRSEIERAQEAMLARFNDINSTDDFDILCRRDSGVARSRASCLSRQAREYEGRMWTFILRGNPAAADGMAVESFRKQQLLNAELRQLSASDEQLSAAVAALAKAQFELTLAIGKTTMHREVMAASGNLPHDAKRMFEIIMGNDPWLHRLTERTFTIADVTGTIRKLALDCAENNRRLDYQAGAEWTVPGGWSSCRLQVSAKRGTTFRLYEF